MAMDVMEQHKQTNTKITHTTTHTITKIYQTISKKSFNKSSESAKQIQESTKSSNIYQKYTDSYYILIYSQYTTIFVG